jgi:hypothetical protein
MASDASPHPVCASSAITMCLPCTAAHLSFPCAFIMHCLDDAPQQGPIVWHRCEIICGYKQAECLIAQGWTQERSTPNSACRLKGVSTTVHVGAARLHVNTLSWELHAYVFQRQQHCRCPRGCLMLCYCPFLHINPIPLCTVHTAVTAVH